MGSLAVHIVKMKVHQRAYHTYTETGSTLVRVHLGHKSIMENAKKALRKDEAVSIANLLRNLCSNVYIFSNIGNWNQGSKCPMFAQAI